MCGIIGAVGNLSLEGRKMVKMMLLLDQVRGFNSTGVACIDNDDVFTLKKAVHSTDFLDMKLANGMLDDQFNKAIIGHNRAATIGAVTNENAHPFTHGNITGVHNGTLRGQYLLPDYKDFDVDSDNIFHAINLDGAENTIKKLHGAFTLVWWDALKDTVNLVRNSERPMCYAYSKDGRTLFYASESWMLTVSAMKCSVKLGEVHVLPVGKLMTIDIGGNYSKLTTQINTVVKLKEVELYKEYVAPKNKAHQTGTTSYLTDSTVKTVEFEFDSLSRGGNVDTYYGHTTCGGHVVVKNWGGMPLKFNSKYTGSTTMASYQGHTPTYTMTNHAIKLVSDLKKLLGWNGRQITREEKDRKLSAGCAWCGEVTISDDYVVLGPEEYVCGGCKNLPEVKEYIKEV